MHFHFNLNFCNFFLLQNPFSSSFEFDIFCLDSKRWKQKKAKWGQNFAKWCFAASLVFQIAQFTHSKRGNCCFDYGYFRLQAKRGQIPSMHFKASLGSKTAKISHYLKYTREYRVHLYWLRRFSGFFQRAKKCLILNRINFRTNMYEKLKWVIFNLNFCAQKIVF